ncbi:MAG: Holliday junction branch migration protein RuvA [Chloroflexi bacterium]|nr:Holliday junction branch migration protein RuvA [Chloroflexota bacterium]
MIATLEGQIAQTSADNLIVTVGGVGLEVIAPYSTTEKLGAGRVFLYTRLVVREDSLTLYGFGTVGERELFDAALKISGIGPKIAIAMLSTLTVDHIRSAVLNDRPEIISRVPGIGKKTAQKVVLELQDRLSHRLDTLPTDAEDDTISELIDALTGLGYSVVEAQTAIQQIPLDAPSDLEERLLLALQSLSR